MIVSKEIERKIDELRAGDGSTLDELNYGNDITDQFIEDIKNDKYTKVRD